MEQRAYCPESPKTPREDEEMETATLKQFLLVSCAAATLLGVLCANGAPAEGCPGLHNQLRLYKLQAEAARKLRIKYEHLVKKEQPWRNCSVKYRRPDWKLPELLDWDKLEALERVVNLSVQVLQNRSEEVPDKIAEPVLEVLIPLRLHLQGCVLKKPSGHNESESLHKFKEQFQKFKAGNLEQSPKCLEAAVGLDIHRLLKTDIHRILG